jgi:2-dehydropantoate 2-reductase
MPAKVTKNLWGYLWGKLVLGATGFVVSCVDAPVAEVIANPLGRTLARAASSEAYAVARTRTDKVEPIGDFDPESFASGEGMEARADTALMGLADSWRGTIKQHMGIWRDLKVKRRKTEVDEQVGKIVAAGRERDILTPVNEAVLSVVHEIEAGERGMGWDNLEEIARRSGLTFKRSPA